MMSEARFDAEADGPSPAGRCQAEGGRTPGPVPHHTGLPSGRPRPGALGRPPRRRLLPVPQDKDLKRLVRARMAETGQNYTQALTTLLGEKLVDHVVVSQSPSLEAGQELPGAVVAALR